VLRDLGFHDVRVRHHELRMIGNGAATPLSPMVTHLARIELAPAEISGLMVEGKFSKVGEELKKIGYAHVTLDLQGYRRGSTNEVLGGKVR
jgi:pyridinium-3,5-biscarboxylic acid mononucleotide sulfurtransferase